MIAAMARVFRWLGPPHEILSDNALAFKSEKFKAFCKEWGVTQIFRAVDRASGNAIIERNHGTIKTMYIRTGGNVEDLVRIYNLSIQGKEDTIPAEVLFGRTVENPFIKNLAARLDARAENQDEDPEFVEKVEFEVGDRVVIKPTRPKCMERWKSGQVTRINSPWNIEVNGVPRHFKDLRHSRRPEVPMGGGGGGPVPFPPPQRPEETNGEEPAQPLERDEPAREGGVRRESSDEEGDRELERQVEDEEK